MINQIDIYLRSADIAPLYSDLGIKLHGFVMSKINAKTATRKTNGVYTNPPDLCKYFTTVATKLHSYENISVGRGEIESLFANIKISKYIYESKSYMIGGKTIPAMTGSFDISLSGEAEKLKLMLGYATYSGIGAKTSLGMGGFLVGR